MNPLLVWEVQPPLIYVGGDGRLKNIQSIYIQFNLLFSRTFTFVYYLSRRALETLG